MRVVRSLPRGKRLRRALAVVVLIFTIACSSKETYLKKGDDAYAVGKYSEAALAYRKAIQKDPRFGDASYKLGLTELKLNRADRALRAFRRAVALMHDHEDAKVQVADLYAGAYASDARRPEEYRTAANQFTDDLLRMNPRCWQAMRIKGQLAIAGDKTAEAERWLREANHIQPLNANIVVPLAHVLIAAGKGPEAEALVLELLDRDRTVAAAYDVLYLRYVATRRFDDAEKLLERKIAMKSTEPVFRMQLCSFYSSTRKEAQLQSCLNALLQMGLQAPQVYTMVGDFYLGQGDAEAAIATYRKGMRAHPGEAKQLHRRSAEALASVARFDEAAAELDEVIKSDPSDEDSRTQKAMVWLATGKRDRIRAAIGELRKVTKEEPRAAMPYFVLGRACVLDGDLVAARSAFRDAIRRNADFVPGYLALAETLIAAGEYRDAVRQLEQATVAHPRNGAARVLRASALTGAGAYAAARSELTQLLMEYPGLREARLQMALIDLAQGHIEIAEKALRILHTERADAAAIKALVEVLIRQRRFGEAIGIIDRALVAAPEQLELLLLRAEARLRSGEPGRAAAEYAALLPRNEQSADLHFRLGFALFLTGKHDEARPHLEKAIQIDPADPRYAIALGSFMESTERRQDAIRYYRLALRLQPDNADLWNSLAYNLVETRSNFDEAAEYARRATQAAPDNAAYQDTLAWVYARRGMNEAAIRILSELVRKAPKQGLFRYHFGTALMQSGDSARAKQELTTGLMAGLPPSDAQQAKELIAKAY